MSQPLPEGDAGRIIGAVPRRISSPIFVGRVAERAALSEALERAAAGRPGIVAHQWRSGCRQEPAPDRGVDPRRRNARRPRSAGVCVDVAPGTLAYAPFVIIVRDLHRAGFTASLPASTRAELGRLVPEIAPDASDRSDAGQGGQGRLFAAVRDLLAVASASTPILVTIEDLHWADASTLDLVTYLARSMQTEHCLLVATARLDTLPRRHPLLGIVAELARLPWLERIDLARFDEGELVQQLTGILGRVPDPEMAHEVFERSDGNAFFAEELVATGAVGGGPLPASLRERAGRAPGSARRGDAGDRAGGGGRRARGQPRAARAGRRDAVAGAHRRPPRGRRPARARCTSWIPRPDTPFGMRSSVKPHPTSSSRPSGSRSIARSPTPSSATSALSPAGELARTGEIAYHAMAANDLSRALTASLAAVAVAEQASAYAEAEIHLDRILDIWPRIPDAASQVGMDHAELLARTARAAASAGHQARAVALARDALAGLDPSDTERRVATLLELFDYAWEAADIETADRVVLEAMPMLRDERSARSAQAFARTRAARLASGSVYECARGGGAGDRDRARLRGASGAGTGADHPRAGLHAPGGDEPRRRVVRGSGRDPRGIQRP